MEDIKKYIPFAGLGLIFYMLSRNSLSPVSGLAASLQGAKNMETGFANEQERLRWMFKIARQQRKAAESTGKWNAIGGLANNATGIIQGVTGMLGPIGGLASGLIGGVTSGVGNLVGGLNPFGGGGSPGSNINLRQMGVVTGGPPR